MAGYAKRFFRAEGQRCAATKLRYPARAIRETWPEWAQREFGWGYMLQLPKTAVEKLRLAVARQHSKFYDEINGRVSYLFPKDPRA